jgi:hypothetical protein
MVRLLIAGLTLTDRSSPAAGGVVSETLSPLILRSRIVVHF